ncbi:MAG: alpha-N-acetylglucosaminidase [Sphingobacteriales bacterium]|nr:MAG: alpha-N-acetylglucosaminidase [Sphingobacteriales bacterium]
MAVLLFTGRLCAAQDSGESVSKNAVYDLIKRVVPKVANRFKVEFIQQVKGKDRFELQSINGMIVLRGTNGIAVASALNYYLKNYAHCDITWNGTNLNLPSPLPAVPKNVVQASPYQYRYYLNYCTFNYTMSWWDWDRWQQEIDWMALNGINMPLAITGQNAIWQKVYKSMGFSDKDLEGFFSGPAYFNWFYMGNLDGWGGPLPQSIITGQEELQKKILARERSLGMTPILPAFTGHVPPAFKDKFPAAKLKKTHWTTFPDVYILDPNDPMFTSIGSKFLTEEIRTFGTDHLYTADTFNENTPPSNDTTYLHDVSKKVFESMAAADDKAVWIMQGWLFYHQEKFWQPAQIKALLNAVPDDRMVILDLWTENHPVWNRTQAYYGKPWIWCMLHNFGGNISLYGRMDNVAQEPVAALKNPDAGKMVGIGLTPEAIEQNPAIYQLMLENVWRNTPIDVDTWLKAYARRRYGKRNEHAQKAWEVLHHTVYTGGILPGGPESIITGRPTFAKTSRGTRPQKNYQPKALLPAWDDLVKASAELKNSDGFQYDLVDVTRQVLVNYADTLQQQFAQAYKAGDMVNYNRLTRQFLMVIDDTDQLLATRQDFLLGKWLNDAKKWGTTSSEKRLFEKNARNLITLWGDKNSTLSEYSCRQWSGMLSGYYKPRWEQFFTYVTQQAKLKKSVDQLAFDKQIKDWEWSWVNGTETYPDVVTGNSVVLSQRMFQKYHTVLNNLYQ